MSDVTIKPIETQYKGYCFRSRLEARWAVFFDALGVPYEYEVEGYDLGETGWYLPDFYLPHQHAWVEVKGAEPTHQERQRCHALSVARQELVVLVSGNVGAELIDGFSDAYHLVPQIECFAGDFDDPATWHWDAWTWDSRWRRLPSFLAEQFPGRTMTCTPDKFRSELVEWDREYFLAKHGQEHWAYRYGTWSKGVGLRARHTEGGTTLEMRCFASYDCDDQRIVDAMQAARRARFEHGAAPIPF